MASYYRVIHCHRSFACQGDDNVGMWCASKGARPGHKKSLQGEVPHAKGYVERKQLQVNECCEVAPIPSIVGGNDTFYTFGRYRFSPWA